MNPDFNEHCFLELLFIKILKPKLNIGIKASKELINVFVISSHFRLSWFVNSLLRLINYL